MKRVDMSLVDLVHSGEAWPHSQPPCSRQMIRFLERNEDVITWVQARASHYFFPCSDNDAIRSPSLGRSRTSSL